MSVMSRGTLDSLQQILQAKLDEYESDHPGSTAYFYRQNSVSIRVKIIDPQFAGLNEIERERIADQYLDQLPDEVAEDITLLLLFTPAEIREPRLSPKSLTNLEFDDPQPSRL